MPRLLKTPRGSLVGLRNALGVTKRLRAVKRNEKKTRPLCCTPPLRATRRRHVKPRWPPTVRHRSTYFGRHHGRRASLRVDRVDAGERRASAQLARRGDRLLDGALPAARVAVLLRSRFHRDRHSIRRDVRRVDDLEGVVRAFYGRRRRPMLGRDKPASLQRRRVRCMPRKRTRWSWPAIIRRPSLS